MKFTDELKSYLRQQKLKSGVLDRNQNQSCLQTIMDNPDGITVSGIWKKLRIEQAVCSQSLRELRKWNLVKTQRSGKYVKYFPNVEQIKSFFGIEKLPSGETKEVIQVHATMNFWYACNNIDKRRLIYNVFSESDSMHRQHLEDKFKMVNYSIFEFIDLLDENHRGKLITYILKTYEGVSIEKIKNNYLNL